MSAYNYDYIVLCIIGMGIMGTVTKHFFGENLFLSPKSCNMQNELCPTVCCEKALAVGACPPTPVI